MFSIAIQLDRIVTATRLAAAFAAASGVGLAHIRVITRDELERSPWRWFTNEVGLGIQTTEYRGDVPFEVAVYSRDPLDTRSVLESLAHDRGVFALTDQVEVNPLADTGWLMISPDGSSVAVDTDSDEFGSDTPAIILEPEFRAVSEAKRSSTPATL